MAIPGAEEVLPEGSGPYGNQYYQTDEGKAYLGNAVNGFVGVQREDEKGKPGGYPKIEEVSFVTTINGIRSFNSGLATDTFYTVDEGKAGNWKYVGGGYNNADDNTGTFLVDSVGRGYRRILENNVALLSFFDVQPSSIIDQTAKFQKALDGISIGQKLSFLGDHVISNVKRFEDKFIEGNNSRILQTGNKVVFEGKGVWQYKVNVSLIETVSVTQLGQTYYVTKITCDTAGYAAKDLVKIYSRDLIPDTSIPGRYIGEFAQVVQVFPTYLLLNSTLEDTYITQVRIAKLTNKTANINGIRFGRKAGEAIVVPQDAGSGGGAFIRLSGLVNPSITNCVVEDSISNAVVMHSCFGYNIDVLQATNLPNQPTIMRWGYGVCDANSEFGKVSKLIGRNVRHAFTTNTYVIDGDIDDPANYGRSKHFNVIDSQGFGGFTAHFDTHDGARGGSFNNCKGVFSDWGPDENIEPSVDSNTFVIRSSGTRIIDCEGTSDCGVLVYTPPGQNAGNNEATQVKNVEIINFKGSVKRRIYNIKNAKVRSYGGLLERAKGANYGAEALIGAKLFNVEDSSSLLEIYNPTVIERGENSLEILTTGDGSVVWDGGSINMEEVIINGSGQQTNFNNRIFYTYKATTRQNITFKNVTLYLKDRLIDSIARCAGGIINASIQIENITVVVTSTSKTISTGGAFTRRIIGGSGTDVRLAIGYPIDKVNINNVKYLDVNTNLVSSNEYTSQTTSIIQNFGKSDKFLYANINPGTDDFNITAIEAGKVVGQLLVIRNVNTTRNIILPSSLANTAISGNLTIGPKTEINLRWSSGSWELVVNSITPVNLVTRDTAQRITGEKTFESGKLIIDGPAGTARDIKFRSDGSDRVYLRITESPETGANSGSNAQILARNDNGSFLGFFVTFIRKTLNAVFGEDSTDYPSSLVTMNSVTKGFMPPRLTTAQRNDISSPFKGLTVYNSTTDTWDIYTGSSWKSLDAKKDPIKRGSPTQMVINQPYTADNAVTVQFTMPLEADSKDGDFISITGLGSGGWKLNQNPDQVIHTQSGNTTPGIAGFIESTNRYDHVLLHRINTNEWTLIAGSISLNIN